MNNKATNSYLIDLIPYFQHESTTLKNNEPFNYFKLVVVIVRLIIK